MAKDITKPSVIQFLNEMYEKESLLRAQWNYRHQDMLKHAATLGREPTDYFETDVIMQNMIGGIPTIAREHINAGNNRKKVPLRDAATIPRIKDIRHGHSIVNMGLGNPEEDPRLVKPDTDLSFDPVMCPIENKVKKILSKPRPMFGREQYLRQRAKKWPEKKYYFAECTNWDYGWRISDSGKLMNSEYGRIWLLNRTLHSRVGPQPDPSHYNFTDISGVTKCNET